MTTQFEARARASAAWTEAQEAADSAGVEVRVGLDDTAIRQLQAVVAEVWSTPTHETMLPTEMLHALQHSGNYVAVAVRSDEPVGAAVGFLGLAGGGLHLHSHMTGVAPGRQVTNVGFAMKLHQRAWCLDAGLSSVTWTFDPLVRRNAYFNLVKLGAEIRSFHHNLYGAMSDGINDGSVSDRVYVEWRLLPRAGVPTETQAADQFEPWLIVGPDQGPVLTSAASRFRSCDVPADFVALKRSAPRLAERWRDVLGDVLSSTLSDGGRVSGFARDRGYLLHCR